MKKFYTKLCMVLALVMMFQIPTQAAGITDEAYSEVGTKDTLFKKSGKVKISKKYFSSKSSYTVKWEDFPGADGYQFKVCINKSFKKKYKPTQCYTGYNSMKIRKVKMGKTYYYKVRAFKESDSGKKTYSKWTKTYNFKRKK